MYPFLKLLAYTVECGNQLNFVFRFCVQTRNAVSLADRPSVAQAQGKPMKHFDKLIKTAAFAWT